MAPPAPIRSRRARQSRRRRHQPPSLDTRPRLLPNQREPPRLAASYVAEEALGALVRTPGLFRASSSRRRVKNVPGKAPQRGEGLIINMRASEKDPDLPPWSSQPPCSSHKFHTVPTGQSPPTAVRAIGRLRPIQIRPQFVFCEARSARRGGRKCLYRPAPCEPMKSPLCADLARMSQCHQWTNAPSLARANGVTPSSDWTTCLRFHPFTQCIQFPIPMRLPAHFLFKLLPSRSSILTAASPQTTRACRQVRGKISCLNYRK